MKKSIEFSNIHPNLWEFTFNSIDNNLPIQIHTVIDNDDTQQNVQDIIQTSKKCSQSLQELNILPNNISIGPNHKVVTSFKFSSSFTEVHNETIPPKRGPGESPEKNILLQLGHESSCVIDSEQPSSNDWSTKWTDRENSKSTTLQRDSSLHITNSLLLLLANMNKKIQVYKCSIHYLLVNEIKILQNLTLCQLHKEI
jgi:hypothetical protein